METGEFQSALSKLCIGLRVARHACLADSVSRVAEAAAQRRSLAWIREQSLDPRCVESLANHDTEVKPHVIELN